MLIILLFIWTDLEKKKFFFSFLLVMPSTLNSWPSKEGLRVCFWILIMFITNYQILLNSGSNVHAICFAESGLSHHTSDSDVTIPGYNVMRLDLKTSKDTGLCVKWCTTRCCTGPASVFSVHERLASVYSSSMRTICWWHLQPFRSLKPNWSVTKFTRECQ